MKVIGIVGTRRRNTSADYNKTEEAFLKVYEKGDTICSGLCPKGADQFAIDLSKKYNTETLWFPADWQEHGRAAGFIRNTYIAENSDILIACVARDRTGGTEDTIKKFIKLKGEKNLIII